MKKSLRSFAMASAIVLGLVSANATVLLDADFSNCAAGSEETPEMFKYSFNFTDLGYTGWSLTTATKAGQAGGSLYLADGGGVKTASLTGVTTNGGGIKLTVVVKLNKAEEGFVQLQYAYGDAIPVYVSGSDWQTVEQVITPTSTYSNFLTVSPFLLLDGIFVKSIKIEQSPDFLGSTTAYLPSDADGTSFTARWKAVTGATKYYLDVYSYGADDNKVMFIDNREVATTSFRVEGLEAGTTYYYVVRAANDTGVSGDSNEVEVVKVISELAKPVVTLASSDEEGNFTATWEAVPDAESYKVTVKKRFVFTEAGLANVFAETFDVFTNGTIDDPADCNDRDLELLSEPGWTSGDLCLCMINGAIGFWPYNETYLATPAIDLSADGGNVTVAIRAAYVYLGSFKAGTTIKFSLIDAEENETTPVELDIDQLGFADYSVQLTGGTAASKIKISYDETSINKVMFDNFEVKQILPAGTVNTTTYLSEDVTATEYSGKVEPAENTTYAIVVAAQSRTVDTGAVVPIVSVPSDEVIIDADQSSGVEGVSTEVADNVTVKGAGNGTIEVTAAAATDVVVYDLAGRMVASVRVAEGTTTLNVGVNGIVMVKAGNRVTKIAL